MSPSLAAVMDTIVSSEPMLLELHPFQPGQTSCSSPVPSTTTVASVFNAPSLIMNAGSRKRKLKRPWTCTKQRELPVYPFWSKVSVQNRDQNRDKIVVAEGIIVPGFQTENALVSNSFSRKIYVTKVLGKTTVMILYFVLLL